MDQILFATGDKPEIVVDLVGGDLRLTGWERNEFLAESEDAHSLRAEQKDNRILLSAGADCAVRAPRQASLNIRQIGGDARLKSLEGPAEMQHTAGSLLLRHA